LALFQELFLKHFNPGDIFIDPFLGSVTNGFAAIENDLFVLSCDIYPFDV